MVQGPQPPDKGWCCFPVPRYAREPTLRRTDVHDVDKCVFEKTLWRRLATSEQMFETRHALFLGLPVAYAVPAGGRNISRPAQREPDLPCTDPSLNPLFGGQVTNLAEHQVASDHTAVTLPELVDDGQPEFAHTQGSILKRKRPG